MNAKTVTRVLVIAVARIGDTLLVTPAIKALKQRYPDAKISVLAHPKRVSLLQELPCIDDLSGITKRSAPWRGRWPGTAYDIAVVYGGDLQLIGYALRVAREVFVFEQPGLPASSRLRVVPRPTQPLHAVHERRLLALAAGGRSDELQLCYHVSPVEKKAAQSWLADRVKNPASPLIGLQTLSFPTKAHRNWPLSSFIDLMKKIAWHFPDAHFLLLGDNAAGEQASALSTLFPDSLTVAAGSMSLRQSAALISCLDLYIGVDTGPTHLAGALGIPMVAMYHCAYPGRFLAPLGHPGCVVIEHPLTGQSSAIDVPMSDIGVETVWNSVHAILCGRIQRTETRERDAPLAQTGSDA